ncbi:class I adenylate-forming enzyme family protein [Novosphingobium sp. BL-52-GroH]|uniref:class I adenylate-forming enzyme family protein n=1 Tax=Novosphingobium sp. BL-52-GroH TaxID=3349877 RepID=UPI00384B6639
MAFTVERALKWWARDKPDTLALHYDGETVTFGELNAWALRIAAYLDAQGVRPGDRVAMVAANSLDYAALIVGTVLSGAIANPLSFRASARDLAKSFGITDPLVVFADEDRASTVADALGLAGDRLLVSMATVRALRDAPEPAAPAFEARPEDPVFIIGTSGSTGFPKGVIYSHGGTMTYAAEFVLMQPATGHGGGALVTGPYSSASGTLCMLQFLAVGATVYSESRFSPESALRLLREHRITTFLASTIFFERIAALPEFENADLSSIAFAQISGARVNPALLQRYREKGVVLRQAYGSTEAGGAWAARDDTAVSEPEKCGPGAMFSRFKVVREDGAPADPGESGEILIASDCLATGYWNDPEQTAATFRDGWLHTADRGMLDARGNLTFIDRIKDIIITGGLNVSAMEVEAAICEMPGIEETVVIAVPDDDFGEAPLAIVHGPDAAGIQPAAVIRHCREALASYKVPRYVTVEPEPFPRLPSGKIDKKTVREAYAERHKVLEKLR